MCHIQDYVFAKTNLLANRLSGLDAKKKRRERQREGCGGDLRGFFMYRKSEAWELFSFIAVFEVNHDRFMFTIYSKLD